MKMWKATGQAERKVALMVATLTVFAITAAITIAVLATLIFRQYDRNAFLETQRIMIGLPDEKGYFVSTNSIPKREVMDFSQNFVVDCFNWAKLSATTNLSKCEEKMDESLAILNNNWLESRKKQASQQQVKSVYIPDLRRLEETKEGYEYTVRGTRDLYQGRSLYYSQLHEVTVELRQGQPTTFRPLGLVVSSWKDKCLDCK